MTRLARTAAKSFLLSAALFVWSGLVCAPSHAQSASRIHMHGEGAYAADGLFYVPTGQGPFAAVLLIPDQRGLTRRVTDAAESLVDAGYVVVAVDLNRGLPESDVARSAVDTQLDLDAALAFLANQSNVRRDSVGAMGWGSGAINTLAFAAAVKLSAVVVESIPPAQDISHLHAIPAALLAVFTAPEAITTHESGDAVQRRLHVLSKRLTIKVYRGMDGGFDDPDDTGHYSPSASADLRRIVIDFFGKNLRISDTK